MKGIRPHLALAWLQWWCRQYVMRYGNNCYSLLWIAGGKVFPIAIAPHLSFIDVFCCLIFRVPFQAFKAWNYLWNDELIKNCPLLGLDLLKTQIYYPAARNIWRTGSKYKMEFRWRSRYRVRYSFLYILIFNERLVQQIGFSLLILSLI